MAIVALFCTGALVSCSTDNSAEVAQSKVDSIVNAKTTFLKLLMRHNNDSLINAKALERADSMMPVAKTSTPAKK